MSIFNQIYQYSDLVYSNEYWHSRVSPILTLWNGIAEEQNAKIMGYLHHRPSLPIAMYLHECSFTQ